MEPKALALAAAALLAPAAHASDKIYQNDTVTSGGNATVQAGFAKNEIAAAVFTVPAGDGTVFLQNARVLFYNALGPSTPRKMRIVVYGNGSRSPGAPLFRSPLNTLLPGGENLVDLSAPLVELAPGQSFTIGAWKVGNPAFGFRGTGGPAASTPFLGIAEAPAAIPILGITLLVDPAPAGRRFCRQARFVDGGAAAGLAATAGLDVLVSP